jgi:hypothetical protein
LASAESGDRRLVDASARLDRWLENQQFAGWDPHDALRSPLVRRLTFGNRWLAIAYVQALRRSPINLRRALLVRPGHNPKGMGLFLASYVRKSLGSADVSARGRVGWFFDWLETHASPGYAGKAWGYNFDWPNRSAFIRAGVPTVVNTAFVGQAFLDAYEMLGEVRGLEIARSACDFILHDLNRPCDRGGELCFSYTPLDQRVVHNANAVAAALLARTWTHTREPPLLDAAAAALAFTVARQRPDGSWPYGEGRTETWIDSFHTGYVLVALALYEEATRDLRFRERMLRGREFWKQAFVEDDGLPRYYPDRRYPIDAHCGAQAVLTLLRFEEFDVEALPRAERVLGWLVDHMQEPAGWFDYQVHSRYRIRIPYVRWTQAWVQRAFAEWALRRRPTVSRSLAVVEAEDR